MIKGGNLVGANVIRVLDGLQDGFQIVAANVVSLDGFGGGHSCVFACSIQDLLLP